MKQDANDLLWKWFRRSLVAQTAHYDCASRYFRLHYWMGFPSIILTTIVGSSIFASINTEDAGSSALKWVFGCLSIFAASLGAAQTFLRFGERAEAHRMAGVRYSALKREIEHYTVFEPANLEEIIIRIRGQWDALTSDCPIIPQATFHAAERRVYAGKGIASGGGATPPGKTPAGSTPGTAESRPPARSPSSAAPGSPP